MSDVTFGEARPLTTQSTGETLNAFDAAQKTFGTETVIDGKKKCVVFVPGTYDQPVCHGVRGDVKIDGQIIPLAFDIPYYPATEEEEAVADTFFDQHKEFMRNGHVRKLTDMREIGAWEADYKRTTNKNMIAQGVSGSHSSPRAAVGTIKG